MPYFRRSIGGYKRPKESSCFKVVVIGRGRQAFLQM